MHRLCKPIVNNCFSIETPLWRGMYQKRQNTYFIYKAVKKPTRLKPNFT